MMTRAPHTHPCPYCRQDVPCEAIQTGVCIFSPTSGVTCNPCAERHVAAMAADPEHGLVRREWRDDLHPTS